MTDTTTEMRALEPCPFCDMYLRAAVDPRLIGMLEHPPNLHCPISAACFIDTLLNRSAWNRRSASQPQGDVTGLEREAMRLAALAGVVWDEMEDHGSDGENRTTYRRIAARNARRGSLPHSDGAVAEPVAWRWRWGRMGDIAWKVSLTEPMFREDGYEKEPLYASPAAPERNYTLNLTEQETDALEALAKENAASPINPVPAGVGVKELEAAWSAITEERQRQIAGEGWSSAHDDAHDEGEMLTAAVTYLWHDTPYSRQSGSGFPMGWPWDAKWWKPKDRRSNVIRAGALCLAEHDRLIRAGKRTAPADHKLGIALRELAALILRQAPDAEQGAEPVAWMGFWPGAGSVNSITDTTHRQHIADRWRDQGAEITPLVAAPQPRIGDKR